MHLLKRVSSGRGSEKSKLSYILSSHIVKDVVAEQLKPGEQGLKSVRSHQGVLDVCSYLQHSNVSSLPVFDDNNNCIGVVTFADAVAFLINQDWRSVSSSKEGDGVWSHLGKAPIQEAIPGSINYITTNLSCTLIESIGLFARHRVRRLLVVNESGTVVAVLSPSAIVKFVIQKQIKSGISDPLMSMSIKDLDLGSGPVESVSKNQTLIEALHLMYETKHSVTAVVDPLSGELVGSISSSDIKEVFETKQLSILVHTCWKHIIQERAKSDSEVFPYFGVQEGNKLEIVISKLLVTHVHHLYVVDDHARPVRVLSFTDICTLFYENCRT